MHKKITIITGLLILLSLPHIGMAQNYEYIPSTSFFANFAKPRTASKIVAEQQAKSIARREEEQAAARAANNESLMASAPEETTTHTSADTDTNATTDSFISPDTLQTLRMIERIQQNNAEQQLKLKALELLGGDLSLHGGADLQSIGKGDIGKGTIGKGPIGKGGEIIPEFLPTQTVVLAPTGAGTMSAIVIMLIGIVLTAWYALKDKSTAIAAE